MVKLIFLTLLTLCSSMVLSAQIRALQIGDTVPDDVVLRMINDDRSERTLNENSGKFTVLDFGTTYCIPCLGSLQKLEELKEQFGDKIDFLFISPEKKDRMLKFLSSNDVGKNSTVSIVYEDTILHSYFKHISTPHVVWISDKGRVMAYTDHHFLNQSNLQHFLSEDILHWPVKWDFPFDYRRTIMQINDGTFKGIKQPSFIKYASLSGNIEGVQPRQGAHRDTLNGLIRNYAVNTPIIRMYASLLKIPWLIDFFPTQLVFEVDDTSRYYIEGSQEDQIRWLEENAYCYEIVFPDTLTKSGQTSFVVEQLNLFFGIEVSYKKEIKECRVLKQGSHPTNKGTDSYHGKTENTISLDEFIYFMNLEIGQLPLINDLEEEGESIVFNRDCMSDKNVLDAELTKQGLILETEKREIDVLIIKERFR